MRKWGLFLLALWFIVHGLFPLIHLSSNLIEFVYLLLAVPGGLLLFFGLKENDEVHRIGGRIFSIWIVAFAVYSFIDSPVNQWKYLLAGTAIISGILLPLKVKANLPVSHIGNVVVSVWLILTGLLLWREELSLPGLVLQVLSIGVGYFLLLKNR